VDEVFNLLTDSQYRYSLPKVLDYIKAQKAVSDKYGVQLMAYEGGQGLVDFKTTSNEQMPNPLLYAANRDARMADLYSEFLNGWKQAGGRFIYALHLAAHLSKIRFMGYERICNPTVGRRAQIPSDFKLYAS
jgi:hypothetical protein